MRRFETLRVLKKEWIAELFWVEMAILLGGIVANFALGWWNPDWLGFGVMIGFPLALLVALVQWGLFYNLVKCPTCNGKLNRFKNGRRVPIKQAYTQLGNGYGCRHCGWKPPSSETEGSVG